jgi:4-amino-4-deoxy-L-arabinose transferase-like glycosyltransferase
MSARQLKGFFVFERVASVLLLLLGFWVLCYRLDAVPMKCWDESRQANNALEMLQSGNWLYPTYEGQPDFWNTKPHLLIVLQTIGMKMLGPGLLALRLPSALAGCLTLVLWFRFIFRRQGYLPAASWVLVMLGCGGFNAYHIVRTGDYDALLTLCISGTIISWIQLLENPESRRYYLQAGGWFAAALLTKGIAAAIWLPVLLIIPLDLQFWRKFKIRFVFNMLLIPLVAVVVYYGYREWITPGYLKAVFFNEWSGRYFNPNEGHKAAWWYYLKVLWQDYFTGYIALLIIAWFWVGIINGKKEFNRLIAGIVLFMVIISASATRIYWYLAPAIPIMAYLVVSPLFTSPKPLKYQWMWLLCLIGFAVPGYFDNYNRNTTSHGVRPELVLMQADKNNRLPYQAYWQIGSYNPIEKYYKAILENKGISLKLSSKFDYKPKDTVIISQMPFLDSLNKKYVVRQHHYPNDEFPLWVMVVEGSKSQP